jgi:hypothetical protein
MILISDGVTSDIMNPFTGGAEKLSALCGPTVNGRGRQREILPDSL